MKKTYIIGFKSFTRDGKNLIFNKPYDLKLLYQFKHKGISRILILIKD